MLVLSVPYFRWMNRVFTRRFRVIRINRLFVVALGLILAGTIVVTVNVGRYNWFVLTLMVVTLLVLQASFMILVVTRREMLQRQEREGAAQKARPVNRLAVRSARIVKLPYEEINFHFGFLLISIFALAIYTGCTLSVSVAVGIGSFPFVLLAFAVFLGVGNILSIVSIHFGLNFHFIV